MRVTTKDGVVHKFVITEVTDETLVGESNRILFTEIDKLQEMTITSSENTTRALVTTGKIIMGVSAGAAQAAAGASPNL